MTGPSGEQGNPANSGMTGGAPVFTQEQVNYFNAQAKRGALDGFFKDLGLEKAPEGEELKKALADAAEYRKLKEGEKPELERVKGELDTIKPEVAKVPTLQQQLKIAEMAAEAGLKPRYWKYIEGKTDEEIKASIDETLKDFSGGGEGGAPGATGAGKRPDPVEQQGQGQGKPPAKSLASGAAAYAAKHPRDKK